MRNPNAAAGKGGALPTNARADQRRRSESSQGGSDKGGEGPRSPDEREKADLRRDEGGPGQQTRAGARK
jgi:hypothetical protein